MAQPQNNDHQKLVIKPRHMDFPFGSLKNIKFFDDNIYKSAFMAGLSASFPAGETEFLNSVKNYRDQIKNPALLKQVKGFIGQEGHHSHQHALVNKELDRLGYKTKKVEDALQKVIDTRVSKLTHKFRLAHTVSAEHITAIMAEYLINNPQYMDGLETPFKDLFFWHAVEEVEHKSVCFDVYMEVIGDEKYLAKIMKLSVFLIQMRLAKHMFILVFNSKHWWNLKEFGRFVSWMFGKGGMWRSLRKPYKEFFEGSFHPWGNGGLELIEKWSKDYYRPEQNKASPEYAAAHSG